MPYRLFADLVLLLHVGVVLFVVGGLALVVAGGAKGWVWVRDPWFRWAHLLAIGVVVAQAWLGWVCPLTTWEMALRERAGDAVYSGGFIAHWLQRLLYYEAPPWVFALAYSVFALVVLACWWRVRPQRFRRRR
jgi:polyferredoxin